MSSGQDRDEPLCTAEVNSHWPHRYAQAAEVTANASITPGSDTCGMTEAGHVEFTPKRIQGAEWREACYRKAVEIDAATPHMGHAADQLIGEAHAEALQLDLARDLHIHIHDDGAPQTWRDAGAREWDSGQAKPEDVADCYDRADADEF